MSHPDYPAILQKFSQLDDPYEIEKHDLLALGVTAEMTADLIETILDDKYYSDDYEGDGWPQLYAYIALGQLKTPEAIDGIIAGVKKWAHTDWFEWFCEGIPKIFEGIGVLALEPLLGLLHDRQQTFDARIGAISYLHHVSIADPTVRDRCVAELVKEVEQAADNDREFNAFVIASLVEDYKAVEAAPPIEAAFAADLVEHTIVGDWDDVQVDLGLKEPDPNKKRNSIFNIEPDRLDAFIETEKNRTKNINTKTKNKRKQQKKARQQNRRK